MTSYSIEGLRNPIITITSGLEVYRVRIIGDPHLGRNYRNNNKNRLGHREEMMKAQFIELLNSKDCNLVAIVGDLFDKVSITNEWLSFTIQALTTACLANPTVQYFVLSGNHDISKNLERVSSFKLLESYFQTKKEFKNLVFVSDYLSPVLVQEVRTLFYFSHYNPFASLDDEVKTLSNSSNKHIDLRVAFGHWDTIEYDSNKFINRQVPEVLLNEFDLIITGHEHKPNSKKINGKDILISGSMQPYAFGEEIEEDGLLYVTLSIENVVRLLEKDINYFTDSNVRILYNKEDVLPPPFECLSVSYKIINTEVVSKELDAEALENHSFNKMFFNALSANTTDDNLEYIKEIEKVFLEKSYESN